jgi:hypothetical protein
VFGGNFSDGFLDWLIEECHEERQPSIGQLAAEFEARFLGRPADAPLLKAMKLLWETLVLVNVRRVLSDPVASAVVRAAKKPRGQLSSYEKRLMRKVLLALHRNKKKQAPLPLAEAEVAEVAEAAEVAEVAEVSHAIYECCACVPSLGGREALLHAPR